MTKLKMKSNQIQSVHSFDELISTPFNGNINAIFWERELKGDFSEIAAKLKLTENITIVETEDLLNLDLSIEGELARELILADMKLLEAQGASPVLNLIKNYESEDEDSFFSTDVYSFHVDRSPIEVDTFLCTYTGETSQIIPNAEVKQKVLIPEIRLELQRLYGGNEEGFESFLEENFFDLHYQMKADARPIHLGLGQIWKLAVDHPKSKVLPCVHRAPKEKEGQYRLLLIC